MAEGILSLEISEDYNWGTHMGTWTPIPNGSWLEGDTTIATPEELVKRMGDQMDKQKALRYTGVIRVDIGTAGIPAANALIHVRVVSRDAVAKVYGGADGARARVMETGLMSYDSGSAYVDILYMWVGATITDCIYTEP